MKLYRNYEKTKKAIRDAFISEVMDKKDFDNVTVKNIIEKADIAKSTYYYHYKDIDTLINEICEEIINDLAKHLKKLNDGGNDKKYFYISELTKVLLQYDNFFRALFKSSKSRYFIVLLTGRLRTRFSNERILVRDIKEHTSDIEKTIIINVLANGIAYSFADYYLGSLNVTLEELANMIIDKLLSRLFL